MMLVQASGGAQNETTYAKWCREHIKPKDCEKWVAEQMARKEAREEDDKARKDARQADNEAREEARKADEKAREAARRKEKEKSARRLTIQITRLMVLRRDVAAMT